MLVKGLLALESAEVDPARREQVRNNRYIFKLRMITDYDSEYNPIIEILELPVTDYWNIPIMSIDSN